MEKEQNLAARACRRRGGAFGGLLLAGALILWGLWLRARQRKDSLESLPSGDAVLSEVDSAAVEIEIPEDIFLGEEATILLPAEAPPDDLKRIEGIGPKVARLLGENGIQTYATLAETELARLESILREAGLPFMDPATWPQQATLAASQDWDGLVVLQEQLRGGRRG
ncbi:MAG: hypothetical protein JXB35_15920 [Anaerolineae bacterium]|nr:hypothetical protein [Anaerolineae bacterium]